MTGFDIRDAGTPGLVESWIAGDGAARAPAAGAAAESSTEALDLFAEGSRLMREGHRDEALTSWARAFGKDPQNFVIRKQIWRALYPERFGDPIDLAWQKEQIAREDALGLLAANPGLPRGSARKD